MKKLILTSVIALLALSANKAQQIKFGPKAGVVLSILNLETGAKNSSTEAKTSYYAGGFVEYPLSEKIALQGEIVYADLGIQSEEKISSYINGEKIGTINQEVEIALGTLQVPLALKYYASSSFALSGGADLNFLLSAKKEIKSDLGNENMDVKKVFNSFYITPFIGLEYNFENGLFLDARYSTTVSNMMKKEIENIVESKLTGSFIQIGLGYKFD